MRSSSNSTIVNNTCTSSYCGMFLGTSDNMTIENNTSNDCYSNGLYALTRNKFNTIKNNVFNSNNRGIYSIANTLSISHNNNIINNTFNSNYDGIYLDGCGCGIRKGVPCSIPE